MIRAWRRQILWILFCCVGATATEPAAPPPLADPGVIHAPLLAPLLPAPHERGINHALDPAASSTPAPVPQAATSGAQKPETTPRAAPAGSAVTPKVTKSSAPSVLSCRAWTHWEDFLQQFVSPEGRVVDHSAAGITTSEGQSYALFFALVANDPERFKRILTWTEANLAGGDLTARLPAWQWGKKPDGTWGVMDDNAASDADLWIAYALGEAGVLWKSPRYGAMGELLAARILREETATLPGLGLVLLPGPTGFHAQADVWRLNPSYSPPQLLRRMATLYPHSGWDRLLASMPKLLTASAPRGFAPDWVLYQTDKGFLPDPDTHGIGSYNAIRVYLWLGMLEAKDPDRARLLKVFTPLGQQVLASGVPALDENAFAEGNGQGAGPPGFSAALLPFLDALQLPQALHQQQLRLTALSSVGDETPRYYDSVLALFGQGWMEKRFRFGANGALIPHWSCERPSSSGH